MLSHRAPPCSSGCRSRRSTPIPRRQPAATGRRPGRPPGTPVSRTSPGSSVITLLAAATSTATSLPGGGTLARWRTWPLTDVVSSRPASPTPVSIHGPSGQNVSKPFARAHWPSRLAQVGRGDVEGAGVPEDHRGGLLGRHLTAQPADDDGQLAPGFQALRQRRVPDRVGRPADGGGRLQIHNGTVVQPVSRRPGRSRGSRARTRSPCWAAPAPAAGPCRAGTWCRWTGGVPAAGERVPGQFGDDLAARRRPGPGRAHQPVGNLVARGEPRDAHASHPALLPYPSTSPTRPPARRPGPRRTPCGPGAGAAGPSTGPAPSRPRPAAGTRRRWLSACRELGSQSCSGSHAIVDVRHDSAFCPWAHRSIARPRPGRPDARRGRRRAALRLRPRPRHRARRRSRSPGAAAAAISPAFAAHQQGPVSPVPRTRMRYRSPMIATKDALSGRNGCTQVICAPPREPGRRWQAWPRHSHFVTLAWFPSNWS